MDERALLARSLAGDAAATRALVGLLAPVVQARVARTLVRRRAASAGRDLRQEVKDLTQDVFAVLFDSDGHVLRAWDPTRGLTLVSFCGLVAEREAASILRSGRKNPWKESATELDDLERELAHVSHAGDAELQVSSREQLARLVDRLREALSPRGLELFHRLVVEEESVEAVCASTGMTRDAVYAWKSRIGKVVRKLAAELEASEPRIEAEGAREAMSGTARSSRKKSDGDEVTA